MIQLLDHILYDSLPYGLLVLGLVLTFRYLRVIDLTFTASFVIGPAVMGTALVNGYPFLVGLLAGVVLTCAAAVVTAWLIRQLGMDSLLAGILTSFAGYAVVLLLTQGTVSLSGHMTPLAGLQALDRGFMMDRVPMHPFQIASFAVLLTAGLYAVEVFLTSEAGLAYRTMEDPSSAPQVLTGLGIQPGRLLLGGLVAGNLLCMSTGTLVALRESQVTVYRGFDAVFTGITSYLLGTVLFERRMVLRRPESHIERWLGKIRRLPVTVAALLGLFFYFALINVISLLDVPASMPKLIFVGLVVAALAVSRRSERLAWVDVLKADRTRSSSDGALDVRNATVGYPGPHGRVIVVSNASLRVEPRTVLHLTGENGTGKTTLLRYLAGLIPGSGSVSIPDGHSRQNTNRHSALAYLSQDPAAATCSTLTAEEHLVLHNTAGRASFVRPWRRALGVGRGTEPSGSLPLPPTAQGVPAAWLSGGQRQVLSLSLLRQRCDSPGVVLLDEPLAHLDEDNARRCVELIERLVADGKCVVVVQHDLAPADSYTDPAEARARLARLVTRRASIAEIQRG